MRVIAYVSARDAVPLYAVYSLLFADSGLSPAQLSSLLIIWSLTGFAFEIPSGAWADTIDRRRLLVVSGLIYACGFSLWIVWPGFAGFALGFVLWGLSSAIQSGTFEALVYDELAERGETAGYAGLIGTANATAMVANLSATALAAPLYAWGGYELVGWASVAAALGHTALARTLPPAARATEVDETREAEPTGSTLLVRYRAMLSDGLAEVARRRPLRRAVVVAAAVLGMLSYDEYFPLVLREGGLATAHVALVGALIVGGQAVGAALAGRTEALSPRTIGWALAGAAILLTAGVLTIRWGGFVAIALGYGIVNNLLVVAEARIQHQIEGRARATVTSVVGFSSEITAISVYAFVALGGSWWSFTTIVAILGAPSLLVALAVGRWMPQNPRESRESPK
ncbi:MAG: MFS transporter [Nocardioidaceae bacterium]